MNVFARFIGRIVLYNPVNLWDVQAPGCEVGAEQNAKFRTAEGKKSAGPFVLVLPTLNNNFILPSILRFKSKGWI